MKLNQLRDVLAVADLGSLRAASRHLNVAQPAITRSIREIENELGVTLFERHARGVSLTEMGRTFVRRAEAVDSELRRAREEIAQLKGRTTGEVSAALSTAASIQLTPSAMAAFRKRYPDAIVRISESLFQPVEQDILTGRIDFYVGALEGASASPQFHVEKLFNNRRMVFARHQHPLTSAEGLADLVGSSWMLPTQSLRSSEGDFRLIFENEGLPPPKVVVHARSALTILQMVPNSDLLTVLPEQWRDFPLTKNVLTPLVGIPTLVAAPICIVRRQDMPLTPLAEHLVDLIRRSGTHHAHFRGELEQL